jgi:CHASE2 domain-containing sensor protein
MRRRFLVECLLIAVLVPVLVVWLAQKPGISQADQLVYDTMLAASAQVPSSDVLIVAIDDYSLNALGPWPWQRSEHAKLLDALAVHRPKAVLFDLFFITPSVPEQDQLFAEAIGKLPVFLPSQVEVPETNPAAEANLAIRRFVPPLPLFANAAAGLGHVDVALDSDSVARSIFLQEGPESNLLPYLGSVLVQHLQSPAPTSASDPSGLVQRNLGQRPQMQAFTAQPSLWQEQRPAFRLPFAGPRGSYRTVPYVSILRNEVPPELITGKVILVGATARGFGDEVPTPNAGSVKFLPGVEVHANAIDALMNNNGISVLKGNLIAGAEPGWHYALWVGLPASLLWAVVLTSAGLGLMGLIALSLSVIGLTFLGLQGTSLLPDMGAVWLAPTAPLLGLFLTYALWSWRRFADLYVYLAVRLKALGPLPVVPWLGQTERPRQAMPRESLERALIALDHAVEDLRQFENFLAESIASLPIAVMVCDVAGTIRLSNERARTLIQGDSLFASTKKPRKAPREPFAGVSLPDLLARLESSPHDLGPVTSGELEPFNATAPVWKNFLTREFTSIDKRIFRLDVVPLGQVESPSGRPKGWIVAMPDLTADKKIEEQREQWLGFLSHDLRNPQVNILSLLDLHAITKKHGGMAGSLDVADTMVVDDERLYQQVSLEVQRTIDMAESFIALNKAQGDAYKMDFLPLGAPLLDAIDQMTSQAVAKGVTLKIDLDEADCFIVGDGTMLSRLFTNLMSNALKFTERGKTVTVRLVAPVMQGLAHTSSEDDAAARAWVHVEDEGPGIASDKLGELFSAFTTGVHASQDDPTTEKPNRPVQGIGLGLAFVKTVANRHGAQIKVQSEVGKGSVFSVGFLIDKTPVGD